MKDSTTASNSKVKRIFKAVAALVFWLAVWKAASVVIDDQLSLFLPPPEAVLKRLSELILTAGFYKSAGATLLRIFFGFTFGAAAGFLLGLLTFVSEIAETLIAPAMRVVRAVPVVSFIILAFLFIKVDRLPVFISMLMVTPTVWQAAFDGLRGTDAELVEMCRVYKVSRQKELFSVRLPFCMPTVITAAVNALGLAWKSGVAAEVLCTPQLSIGYSVARAKGNLDFEGVYALTLTVVLLSVVFEIVLKTVCRRFISGGEMNAEAR